MRPSITKTPPRVSSPLQGSTRRALTRASGRDMSSALAPPPRESTRSKRRRRGVQHKTVSRYDPALAAEDVSLAHDEFDIAIIGAGAAGLGAARGPGRRRRVVHRAGGARARRRARLDGEARQRRDWPISAAAGCTRPRPIRSSPWPRRRGLRVDKSPPPWGRASAQVGAGREDAGGLRAGDGAFPRARGAAPSPATPDVACDALLEPGDPFNPLIDAVSTYYSGAELAKVSADDLAAYEDSGVNWRVRGRLRRRHRRPRGRGACALFLPRARHRPSGPRCAIETEAGRAARPGGHRHAAERHAGPDARFLPSRLAGKDRGRERLCRSAWPTSSIMELLAPEEFPPRFARLRRHGPRARPAAYHFRPLGRPLVEAYFGGELAEEVERGGRDAALAISRCASWSGCSVRISARACGRCASTAGAATPMRAAPIPTRGPASPHARPALAAPVEERLFFAGEACSVASYSTAHGAYETGRAAAAQALRALSASGLTPAGSFFA